MLGLVPRPHEALAIIYGGLHTEQITALVVHFNRVSPNPVLDTRFRIVHRLGTLARFPIPLQIKHFA